MSPKGIILGLGSGLASAVLFYSAVRGGVLLKLVLLVLTPLPVMLAGLNWGATSALAGGLAAALLMGGITSGAIGVGVFLTLGVPAVFFAWLAELGRPGAGGIAWYPAGSLLAVMALYGGVLPLLIAPLIGGSYAILKPALEPFLKDLLTQMQAQLSGPAVTPERVSALADRMVEAIPATLAAYWTVIFAINLYLAGRVARASGRLVRAWPDLHALVPPPWFPLLLAAALALNMIGGAPGIAGTGLIGGLLVGFALFGLSVLHAIAKGRIPWLLWLAYAGLFNPAGPYALVLVAVLGLVEPLLRLRDRYAKPPPTTPV